MHGMQRKREHTMIGADQGYPKKQNYWFLAIASFLGGTPALDGGYVWGVTLKGNRGGAWTISALCP